MSKQLIQQLTRIADALEQLAPGTIQNAAVIANETIEQETKPSRKAKQKAEPQKVESQHTHDDLKNALMQAVRGGVSKADAKALLEQYGASKATDVPVDAIGELLGKLGELTNG